MISNVLMRVMSPASCFSSHVQGLSGGRSAEHHRGRDGYQELSEREPRGLSPNHGAGLQRLVIDYGIWQLGHTIPGQGWKATSDL